ncbi:MAG: FAD-binding protein [Roseateles sp.]|nr:MAG: FAD-binding protein [Roseateles sp.]
MSAAPVVAVVGAGLAGLSCARRLAEAGVSVRVFDKSRGVGGRMATRRLAWTGVDGLAREAAADHGVPAFEAAHPDFAQAVTHAAAAGWVRPWAPREPGTGAAAPQWVGAPAMKAWCAALAEGLEVALSHTVTALQAGDDGWALHGADGVLAQGLAAVVLALPPAQAAALLQPHRPGWAAELAAWPMQACWAWMGVSLAPAPDWDQARPAQGPLARLVRQASLPGRSVPPGREVWVAHATPAWSAQHLEQPADALEALLREAVSAQLGLGPEAWEAGWAHRWRYARPVPPPLAPASRGRWDPRPRLGLCGDYLAGDGVEGAWLSGRAVADMMLETGVTAPALMAGEA